MRLGQIIQLVPQCDGGHWAVFGLHSMKAITEALFDPSDVIRCRGRRGRDGWWIHGNKRVHKWAYLKSLASNDHSYISAWKKNRIWASITAELRRMAILWLLQPARPYDVLWAHAKTLTAFKRPKTSLEAGSKSNEGYYKVRLTAMGYWLVKRLKRWRESWGLTPFSAITEIAGRLLRLL